MSEVISHFKAVNGDEGFGEWEVDQVDVKLFLRHVPTSVFVKVNGASERILEWALPLQTL